MVRHTNTWRFNIGADNWEDCVNGPSDDTIHPEVGVGNPAHGIRVDAPAPINDMHEGDLALARNKGPGEVAGVWEIADIVSIDSDQEQNYWNDGEDYQTIIYCRPLDRVLDEPYQEDWDVLSDYFGESVSTVTANIQGSVHNLKPEYKEKYLYELISSTDLSSSTATRLEQELGRTTTLQLDSTVWLVRAGQGGELWEEWNQWHPPIITAGWDVGSPEEQDFEPDPLLNAIDQKHGADSDTPMRMVRWISGEADDGMTPGDYAIVLGDSSVEGVGRLGEFRYQSEGLDSDGSHTYWRSIDYIVRSTEAGAVDLNSLPTKFGKDDDGQGEYSLYKLYETFYDSDMGVRDLAELIDYLTDDEGMEITAWGERVVDNMRNRTEDVSDSERRILELWADVASTQTSGAEFDFANHDRTEEIADRAATFVESPSEDTFGEMWDQLHAAVRRGRSARRLAQWDGSIDDLAELIDEMRTAESYDQRWRDQLGGRTTVWELFGSLHIDEYPIINAATENGLTFFGYETANSYEEAVAIFDDFREVYEQIVGHATADADHDVEVPIRLEIDQLFNVIDKVDDDSVAAATSEAERELYTQILQVQRENGGGGGDESLLTEETRNAIQEEERPELYRQAIAHLVAGRSVVFYGPPGTGKTRAARQVAEWLASGFDLETGNAEWSNYNVVGGWQPDGSGGFAAEPGFLTAAAQQCATELHEGDRPYWLIVDELNRANLDQAFGDVFTLLDIDYRTATTVSYADAEQALPLSFRLLATMNSYDRAQLFSLGYAFRRRFAFVGVESLLTEITAHSYDEWDSPGTTDPGTEPINADRVLDIAREETRKHFKQTGAAETGEVNLPDRDAAALSDAFAETDIETTINDLLSSDALQRGSLDPLEVCLRFVGTAEAEDIIDIGQAAMIDVMQYVTAYYLLFPDNIGPHVVDQAVESYIVPQFDAFMPDLRRASTIDADDAVIGAYQSVVDTAAELGLHGTAETLEAPLESNDYDLI